eukprot:scaffold41172_cov54-Phaeocystis_antarctica.AAC.1
MPVLLFERNTLATQESSVEAFGAVHAKVQEGGEKQDTTRGASLRELQRFFEKKDNSKGYAGLCRVGGDDGVALWTLLKGEEATKKLEERAQQRQKEERRHDKLFNAQLHAPPSEKEDVAEKNEAAEKAAWTEAAEWKDAAAARLRAEMEGTHAKAEATRAQAKAEKVKAEKVAWKKAAEARLRAKLEAAHVEAEKQGTAKAEVAHMHAEAVRGQAQLLEKMNELKAELEVIKNEKQTGCANACTIL